MSNVWEYFILVVLKEQVKYSEQAKETQVFMYIKGTLLHILQKRMIQRKMGQASD